MGESDGEVGETKGSAPTLSATYDPALNMAVGSTPPNAAPDTWNYDGEQRPLWRTSEIWLSSFGAPVNGNVAYDHTGTKVFWAAGVTESEQQFRGCEVYFYGITGQKLARYKCSYSPSEGGDGAFHLWQAQRTQHVGGQLTSWNDGAATTDRLGSLRARDSERYTYFPYGEARTESVAGGGMYAGLESPVRITRRRRGDSIVRIRWGSGR